MPIISKLEKVINSIPHDKKIKRDSLRNYLKKQGVKDKEIDNSEILKYLPETVTGKDLATKEAMRFDKTYYDPVLSGGDDNYQTISALYKEPGSDTYFVNALSHESPLYPWDERNRNHFQEPDYMYHVRGYENIPFQGENRRMIEELQSDYFNSIKNDYRDKIIKKNPEFMERIKKAYFHSHKMSPEEKEALARDYMGIMYPKDKGQYTFDNLFSEMSDLLRQSESKSRIYDSGNWRTKAIEREMDFANKSGLPLSFLVNHPSAERLYRSPQVQNFYERELPKYVQSFAKKNKYDYIDENKPLQDTFYGLKMSEEETSYLEDIISNLDKSYRRNFDPDMSMDEKEDLYSWLQDNMYLEFHNSGLDKVIPPAVLKPFGDKLFRGLGTVPSGELYKVMMTTPFDFDSTTRALTLKKRPDSKTDFDLYQKVLPILGASAASYGIMRPNTSQAHPVVSSMPPVFQPGEAPEEPYSKAVGEAIKSLAVDVAAEPIAGLNGVANMATGGSFDYGYNQVPRYTPRDMRALQDVANVLEYPLKKYQQATDYMGDTAYDYTGSPAVAAAYKTFPDILMTLTGLKTLKGAKGAK